jgi:hypothetical protein
VSANCGLLRYIVLTLVLVTGPLAVASKRWTLFEPGLFDGKFMDHALQDQLMGFIYFSFVTITTLGYGDITPTTTGVATLTYLEALIGQLYIAIMIARLVGLYAARDK